LTGIFKLKGFDNMIHPIPEKESLTIEFKSDQKRLPDRDLVVAVVCLANTDGSEIYVIIKNTSFHLLTYS
jgi:ATP-dependent DNA helicase RecG